MHEIKAIKQSDFFISLAKVVAESVEHETGRTLPFSPENFMDSAAFRSFIQESIAILKNDLILFLDHLEGAPQKLNTSSSHLAACCLHGTTRCQI